MSKLDAEVPTPWVDTIPEGRPITMEYEEIGPYEFLKRRAENEPDTKCMILPKGATLTYGEVHDKIKRCAARMQEMGIEKGDRVALMFNNVPHYVISHYACLAIGAIVVQANPLYTEHELEYLVNNSGAKAIFTLSMFQDKVNTVMEKTDLEFAVYGRIQDYLSWLVRLLGKLLKGRISPIFDPDGRTYDAPKKDVPNTYDFQEFISGHDKFNRPEIDIENDVAIFQYTGGTTGFPKGAMLTHRNVSVNAQQARATIHMVPDNTGSVLTVLPLFHVFGLTACMNLSIQLGVPMILNIKSPPDFGELLDWIEEYGITFFPGVPRMMIEINNHPKAKDTDFSSLIAVISGGAPLPIEVARDFKRIAKADLVEGYGLSETAPLTHVNPIQSEEVKPREGSIGLPAPDTICKVVDVEDYNKTLPIGEVGELCLKGPQIFKGYWDMEEETKNVLKDDGWFRTGDIAKIDEEGFAYIVDRKKDMIIVSGYNVYPREVEEALFKHPAVQEAAVAGMTDEKRGEIVAAWIVLKEGESATKEEIIDHCKEYLAPYKVPKEVTFRDELPTTMVGKVLRRKLQEEDAEEDTLLEEEQLEEIKDEN